MNTKLKDESCMRAIRLAVASPVVLCKESLYRIDHDSRNINEIKELIKAPYVTDSQRYDHLPCRLLA